MRTEGWLKRRRVQMSSFYLWIYIVVIALQVIKKHEAAEA